MTQSAIRMRATRRAQNNSDFKTVISTITIGAIIITAAVILAPIYHTIMGVL